LSDTHGVEDRVSHWNRLGQDAERAVGGKGVHLPSRGLREFGVEQVVKETFDGHAPREEESLCSVVGR
jgi:hypothetical protein